MKTKLVLTLITVFLISTNLSAQDKKAGSQVKTSTAVKSDEQKTDAAQDDKFWQMYMTPGPMHKMLAKSNGDWREDLTFWMAPGAEPTKAEAKCFNQMVMNGLYQESVHSGNMMGMPFEGKGYCGYDNARKVFQSTWIDNMGSGIMVLEGKFDEASNSVTMTGKAVDAASGKIENVKQIWKIVDDNFHILEMYMTRNGKEFKNMEIKMTRGGGGGQQK